MIHLHKDFTPELKAQIKRIKQELTEQLVRLINKNKTAFAKKGIKLVTGFDQEVSDVFKPG